MRQSTQVLLALGAGLLGGAAIAASHSAVGATIASSLEPVGTLWVNSLRMIVIPLVVSAIVIGVTSLPDSRAIGRIGGRAFLLASAFLLGAAAFTIIVAPLVLSGLTIDAAASAALRASAATASGEAVKTAQQLVGVSQWFTSLIPANPIKAVADGTMLPVIFFAVLASVAVASIPKERGRVLVAFAQGVYDASITLMRWVMVLAPLGVFCLTLPFAHRLGFAAAGAVLYYVSTVVALCVVVIAMLYLVAWLVGGVSPRQFARACAPSQAIAISARSSLVALPAMVEGADMLGLPLAVRTFFLPLAAAVFKTGSAVMIPVGAMFMAKLYGVELGAAQLMSITLVTWLTTFSVPGVPGGTVIVMVPVLSSAGLPLAAIGLLLGVDAIPDMVRTVTHVTGDMAAATVLARSELRATSRLAVLARQHVEYARAHERIE
jgi:Na+/H+-dicarboxylate symporter